MKRAMVYLIAISTLVSALLSGCGEMGTKAPAAAPAPSATVRPQESMLPDESDGAGLYGNGGSGERRGRDV